MDFLTDPDLFYIIVIRKSSYTLGTFGLGSKWHQRTVRYQYVERMKCVINTKCLKAVFTVEIVI